MEIELTSNTTDETNYISEEIAPTTNETPIAIESQENDLSAAPPKKSRLKSVAWQHFTKHEVNGKEKAKCNHCGKFLVSGNNNGTKHLLDHINSCPLHRRNDPSQQHIIPSFQSSNKGTISSYSFDQDSARKELAKAIILHGYPLSVVEHIGFRRFANALQPVFTMPSRNTVKSDIFKIFDIEKERAQRLIFNNESRVAITSDMWTSSNQKRGFMAITAHFIDGSWVLQSRILRFVYVPCPHTSNALSEVMLDCLLRWNLDHKLSTITLDNCTTNDAMIEILRTRLDEDDLLCNGNFLHMRCCAHILNLIVKDGLDVIKVGIEKIRDSVVFWTATPKRKERFEEIAKQVKVPTTKSLILDCPTRWNSTFLMLEIAILYKEVFFRLKRIKEPHYSECPSEEQWKFAKEICEKLKLFNGVTELFSGTKYPTANLYFPRICEIKMALIEWKSSPVEVVKSMAQNMLEKFEKYWSVIHVIMGVAIVLDPRYKMSLVEFYFDHLFGSESVIHVARIRRSCYDLVSEYQLRNSQPRDDDTIHVDSLFSSSGNATSGSTFDQYLRKKKKQKIGSSVKSELDYYLEEDEVPFTVDFDVLNWWKVYGLKFPTLQAIARDIFAIPVSTVASESAFSAGGRIISPHRSRLHPDTVEAIMCTQNWLWAAEKRGGMVKVMDEIADCVLNEDIGTDEPVQEMESCVTELTK